MKTNFYTRFKTVPVLLFAIMLITKSYGAADKAVWPFTLNCPADVTVSCTDEIWDLSMYGNATYTYGYHTYSAGSPTVHYYLNSCNAGYITRTWMVEDYNWNWHSCTQTIYVSSSGSGGPSIVWPLDITLEGCNPNTHPNQLPDLYDYPSWVSTECSMLGRSYSDRLFTVNSQCKKIMRTWCILDWCDYHPSTGYKQYMYSQFIYIISSEPPAINCPAEITVNALNCKNAELTVAPLTIDPGTCGGNYEITNNSPYSTSKGANISGIYPIGTTKVKYTVKYGCGNFKSCTVNVVVKNGSKPTPYCIGTMITALMGVDTDGDGQVDDGMVELWAKDLDKGSKSLCGYHPLKFSFSPNVNETSKVFTCDNIGKNNVKMYVTDSKGAQSYCVVEIIIQNNGANIPNCHPELDEPEIPLYSVRGTIQSVSDFPLDKAEVTLKYVDPIITYSSTFDTTETLQLDSFINASGYKLYRYLTVTTVTEKIDSTVSFVTKKTKTNALGQYLFDSLVVRDKKVSISATYTDAAKKGLDNKDVELLTKYLLGEISFNNYLQYLAADIDEDGEIDIEDQNILMQLVTNEIPKLPGDNQWYVLDRKATFANPEDALTSALPYEVFLDTIAKDSNVVNFVGIKKGNLSIDAGSVVSQDVSTRSAKVEETSLKVYPNPFTTLLNFDLNVAVEGKVNIRLLNSIGQEIHNSVQTAIKGKNTITIDVNNDISGLVLYQLTIDGIQYTGVLSSIK